SQPHRSASSSNHPAPTLIYTLSLHDALPIYQVEVQHRAASALVARAQGKNQEALNLLRSTTDLEGAMDKHPVTPAPVVPTRELLGELLLELNQPKEALREFEGTLMAEPNRFRSLFGAAQAAERSRDTD